MTAQEEINRLKQLEAEAKALRDKIEYTQRNCKHTNCTEPIYDPETYQEGYGLHIDRATSHGSDPNWVYAGYTTKEKPRWSKMCKECGKVFYTDKTKAVATAPDFN